MKREFDPDALAKFGPDYWTHYAGGRGPHDPDSILTADELFGDLAEAGIAIAGKRVLDLGCGPGHYVKMFRERGALAFGIDIAPAALELAPAEVRPYLYHVDMENLEIFPERSFDLALHNAAVYLPPEAWPTHFRELARILSGYLYLHVIASDHAFFRSLDRERYAFYPGRPTAWWVETVEEAGFELQKIFSHPGWSWWMLFKRKKEEKS